VFAALAQLVARPGELVTREQLLDAVWGHRYITPSTLNRVIALARRALLDDSDEPRFIQTVHGAGYRFVGPIQSSAPARGEPRARFGPPQSARVPARIQALIGRQAEIGQIGAVLDEARALTLLGTGGMGNAHDCVDAYPDGVWFFDLAPVRTAEGWLAELAQALSVAATAPGALLATVCQTLQGRRALLLIDNCDRIAAGIGRLIVAILRGTDQLKILATSQQQLNFVGERVLRLPPLGLPQLRSPAAETELQEIAAAPAVSLLLARVREVQPEFVMSVDNAPAMVDICERLDGMPLALELAAARFAMLSPAQVLERLDQRFRFLVSDSSGRDPRHRNLQALLDWSYQLLSAAEQRFLAWLGVFVQGFTVESAIELAAAFDVGAEAAVDLLTGLANKSLVAVVHGISPPRYRLLETVHEFALGRLAELGDERRARDAHLALVIRMAEAAQADLVGGRMRERVPLIARERANIESACVHALGDGGNVDAALRIAGLLTLYFKAHGDMAMGWRLVNMALGSGVPATPGRDLCRALACRGVLAVISQTTDPAPWLNEALDLAVATDDRWSEAYIRSTFAQWLAHAERPTEALPHVLAAADIAQNLGDPILRGAAGVARGWWHLARDEIDASLEVLRASRRLGADIHQHHFIDVYIGLGLFRRGDDAAAAAQWRESMNMALAVGHIRGAAGAIEGCAYLAERAGRRPEACRLLGAAARIRARTGIPLFSFWIRHHAAAHVALRAALGDARHREAVLAGQQMREEDACNAAAGLLRELAGELEAS
jgi:non-specific serine/threonine protein kinase